MATKTQKAKDAYAAEKYARGQYSEKTYKIAKKQGVIKDKGTIPAARTKAEKTTLTAMQQRRMNDLSRTASRVQMIESRKRTKKAVPSNRKGM